MLERLYQKVTRQKASRPELVDVTIFSSNELRVLIHPVSEEAEISIGDDKITVPAGTVIGEVKFTPLGGPENPSRAHALASGRRAVENYFNFAQDVSQNSLPINPELPKYLVGITNKRMADFSEKLGFKVDRSNVADDRYFVIGEVSEVEQQYHEYVNSKRPEQWQKILDRAAQDYPEFWLNPIDQVRIAQGVLPHPDWIREQARRELSKMQRLTFAFRAATYTLAGLNLGMGVNSLVDGNYFGAVLSGGVGIGVMVYDQYQRRRLERRVSSV